MVAIISASILVIISTSISVITSNKKLGFKVSIHVITSKFSEILGSPSYIRVLFRTSYATKILTINGKFTNYAIQNLT